MTLPIYLTDDKNLCLMQTKWASQIDPVLAQPWNSGILLKNVTLLTGNNTINHLLQRKLIGWVPVRFRGSWAQIYDNQDTNSSPQLTLKLNASANVVIDLWVF